MPRKLSFSAVLLTLALHALALAWAMGWVFKPSDTPPLPKTKTTVVYLNLLKPTDLPQREPIQRKPSEYLRENFYITNSGVAWEPAIKFTQSVVGVDRVLYAMDYPYQYAPEEVTMMDNMQMSAEDKKKFFQTNAEKVFGIQK